MHARPVSVEDAHHLDGKAVLTPIVKKQSLGAPLSLIVAGTWPNRINMSPISFGLRVAARVPITVACGRLQDTAPQALGKTQGIDGTMHADLGCGDRIMLVVHW